MADNIVQSLPGERLITESGILMAHRASGGFQGQFNDGELESQLKLWKGIVDEMERRNYERVGISKAKYKELVKDEWWSDAKTSIKENRADRIIRLKCSKDLVESKIKVKKIMFIFGMPIESNEFIEVSACPLLR